MKKPLMNHRLKKRLFLTSLALFGGASLIASSVYAAYALTDSAEPFSIRISTQDNNTYLNAGFYLAYKSDNYLIKQANKLEPFQNGNNQTEHKLITQIPNDDEFVIYKIESKIVNRLENYPATYVEANSILPTYRKFVSSITNNKVKINSLIPQNNSYTIYVNAEEKIWVDKTEDLSGDYLYVENSHSLNNNYKFVAPESGEDKGILNIEITNTDLDKTYSISNFASNDNSLTKRTLGITDYDFYQNVSNDTFKFKYTGNYTFYINKEYKIYTTLGLKITAPGLYVQESNKSIYELTSSDLYSSSTAFTPDLSKYYKAYYFDGTNIEELKLDKDYNFFLENGVANNNWFKFATSLTYYFSANTTNKTISITSSELNNTQNYAYLENGTYEDLVLISSADSILSFTANQRIGVVQYNKHNDTFETIYTTNVSRPYFTISSDNKTVTFTKDMNVKINISGTNFTISAENSAEDTVKTINFFTYNSSTSSFETISQYQRNFTVSGTLPNISDPSAISGYTFVGWHEGEVENLTSLGTLQTSAQLSGKIVTESASYYAIYKSASEVVYVSTKGYYTLDTDIELNYQTLPSTRIGYRVLGTIGILDDQYSAFYDDSRDLITESGIYKFKKGTSAADNGKYAAEIYRKVGFRVGETNSCWDSVDPENYLAHGYNSTSGAVSDAYFQKAKNYRGITNFYISGTCDKIIFYRGRVSGFTLGSSDEWNHSDVVSLTNHNNYGSGQSTFKYDSSTTVLVKNDNWWNDWLGGWESESTVNSWN